MLISYRAITYFVSRRASEMPSRPIKKSLPYIIGDLGIGTIFLLGALFCFIQKPFAYATPIGACFMVAPGSLAIINLFFLCFCKKHLPQTSPITHLEQGNFGIGGAIIDDLNLDENELAQDVESALDEIVRSVREERFNDALQILKSMKTNFFSITDGNIVNRLLRKIIPVMDDLLNNITDPLQKLECIQSLNSFSAMQTNLKANAMCFISIWTSLMQVGKENPNDSNKVKEVASKLLQDQKKIFEQQIIVIPYGNVIEIWRVKIDNESIQQLLEIWQNPDLSDEEKFKQSSDV